ncbi:OprD family outer membrane porin [Acinetobacter baumannii]|uniref:OprD family outer membrane porin n=1 Tax=Acinetobacter baumannii TaxID=470 RepID=UPI00264A2D4F|nr:OprD family outer membrane porin [Acinetobacter baumannii]MCZ3070576.1 OprD family porin [Acinetobacter baumannii]MDQ8879959.1 OprD family outer membrane porin [Acinetobacter baumannii]MDQ8890986.1 OprD family outer membrane porin [Acinetobacter baumannii]MDQ8897985.1 OprD family outer membrane porin [Acinetobacter baumannii]
MQQSHADLKDALKRQYLDFNYKHVLNSDDYLTLSFNGYHTRYDAAIYDRLSFPSGTPNSAKENYIMGFSSTYQKDTNKFVVSYQQNTGNNGYDYAIAGDGGGTLYIANSLLSDFNGNNEKSLQLQYTKDFSKLGIAGLTWTTAYVYGWDICVDKTVQGQKLLTNNATEREFFNQMIYTVQEGALKNLSFKGLCCTNLAYKVYSVL